jgi:hypothetical protein
MGWSRFTDRFNRSGDDLDWSLEEPADPLATGERGEPDNGTRPVEQARWIVVTKVVAVVALVVIVGAAVANLSGGDPESDDPSGPAAADSLPSDESSEVVVDDAVFGRTEMRSVTVGDLGLVAGGAVESGDEAGGGGAAVWVSTDGTSWSRVADDEAVLGGGGAQEMNSVIAVGSGLGVVAVGSAGFGEAAWTSLDGMNWSRAFPTDATDAGSAGGRMNDVALVGDGAVVAVGSVGFVDQDAAVWTSVGGRTWSRVPQDEAVFGGDGYQEIVSVTAGGPGLVAVGWDGPDGSGMCPGICSNLPERVAAVWTSVDGVTWSRVTHDEAIFGAYPSVIMNSVTAGGPGLVAVGAAWRTGRLVAEVWTSVDGHTWAPVSHVPLGPNPVAFGNISEMTSVTAGGPGLVAAGWYSQTDRAAVWTSVDGITGPACLRRVSSSAQTLPKARGYRALPPEGLA